MDNNNLITFTQLKELAGAAGYGDDWNKFAIEQDYALCDECLKWGQGEQIVAYEDVNYCTRHLPREARG